MTMEFWIAYKNYQTESCFQANTWLVALLRSTGSESFLKARIYKCFVVGQISANQLVQENG